MPWPRLLSRAGGLAALLLLPLLAVYLYPFGKIEFDDPEAATYAILLRRKIELMERPAGPRFVIAGGSSSLEGFEAETVGKALGRPGVNFAVGAGVGYAFILHETARHLRPGDTVLLAPEFENYFVDTPVVNKAAARTSYMVGSDFFRSLPPGDAMRCVSLLPLSELAAFVLPFGPSVPPNRFSIDVDKVLTGYGDVIFFDPVEKHRQALLANVELMEESLGSMLERFKGVDEIRSRRFHRLLTAFVEDCRGRGITVLATYPCSFRSEKLDARNMRHFAEAIRYYYRSQNVPFVGGFEETRFPLGDMYDTFYHVNAAGRRQRTASLIEALGREGPGARP